MHRELTRRVRAAARRPVIVVPSMLGVRLVDDRGRMVWGATRRLFGGDGPTDVGVVRPAGPVGGFALVPGVIERDVFGGLLRYLERVYGVRLGEELFVLDYDWRQPLAEGARALSTLIARVRGAGSEAVDLIGISSGGNVIRRFLAGDPEEDAVLGPTIAAVERVVYLGVPQRGTVSAFKFLQEGLQIVRRRADAVAVQRAVPGLFDLVPHPKERIFVDGRGDVLDLDHLDPAVWRELRLIGHDQPWLGERLARARDTHARIEAAPHPAAIVIADRHRATVSRVVIEDGRVMMPCACPGDLARYPFAFAPGDGVITEASLGAAPGVGADGPWWVKASEHARTATDAHVHPLVVEALLAPHTPVPRERYLWPRNPARNPAAG